MSQPSQPIAKVSGDTDKFESLSASTQMAAIRLKSANKYIFRALLSIASAALLIRMMGMLNQVVVSARFGAGATMDAYFVASTLPVLLAQLFGSSVESSVIPIYSRVRAKGRKEQASILFSSLLNILIIGSVLIVVLMLIFRQPLLRLSAPGLTPSTAAQAANLAFFIFPAFWLMVVIGFMECILNAEGQFGWPAYAGVLVPLTTAFLVLTFGKSLGVVMLCVGMVLGLCFQLSFFILRAKRAKIQYRPIIEWRNPEIISVVIIAWPALLNALISQASPLIDQIFASYLTQGSISAINYALKIFSVPVGVILASVGRAVLPYLSRQAANKDMKAFRETLRLYVWAVSIGTMLLTAFMIVLAHPIVRILFQRGAFTAQDTNNTSITLIGFVIGLTPMGVGFILAKAFNALAKTRVLLLVTAFSIIANAFFDYVFSRLWQNFGIALSTSAVYLCTSVILLVLLSRTIGDFHLFSPPPEIQKVILKLSLGSNYTLLGIWWSKIEQIFSFTESISQPVKRTILAIFIFIAGVVGVILDDVYTLRVALGSLVILALLRFRYVLLLIWVMVDVFVGSSVPFFNGGNIDTALTVPVILLLFFFPIKEVFKRMPALAFLFAYLFWVFLSIGISPMSTGSFLTLWLLRMDYVAVSVLTICVLTTRKRLSGIIDAILLISTIVSVYGIYGYITKQNGVPDTQISSLFRISSIFAQTPTALATFLSIVIPLACYRAITMQGYKRVIGWGLVILFLLTLILTFTRGTYISVAVSILIMVLFVPSRKLKIGVLGGFVAVGGVVALVATIADIPIFSRFLNQDISSLNGRTYLWSALLDHFDPTSILGNGLNASDALLANLRVGTGLGVIGTAPHNLFLGTLYDHGIIGFILLALVFLVLTISLILGIRRSTGEQRLLFVIALAVSVSMLIQGFEASEIWNQSIGIYFWIVMALPFAFLWPEAQKQTMKRDGEILDEDATKPRLIAMQKEIQKQVTHV
ncbi:MAG: murein biosynthesis integral membrane protein MurJ [Ktedonobacteraceae bacterium]